MSTSRKRSGQTHRRWLVVLTVVGVALVGVAGATAMTRITDSAKMSLAGNPSADLDQCANDPLPSLHTDGCASASTDWVNGNLGASKAVYFEGDSVPYRMRFDNLPLGTHTVTIEWDTTKSGKHALDYLKTYNATVADADPCLGVTPCGSPSTFAIPTVPGLGITQAPGDFTFWGGTITNASAYSSSGDPNADSSQRITLTFTATQANPVLAWAGHIADHHDWGPGLSAVAIPGSPYHTRLIDLDGSGGNQDRSLSADAVIFPATIAVKKTTNPTDGSATFPFTASPAPLTNFSLDGSNSNTEGTNIKTFTSITNFTQYTINESTPPAGWALTALACSVSNGNGGSQSTNLGSAQAQVTVKEGEDWTCTYTNTRATALHLRKVVTNDNGGSAANTAWTLTATKSGDASPTLTGTTPVDSTGSFAAGTYALAETGGPSGYTASTWSCVLTGTATSVPVSAGSVTLTTGQDVTCTITNDDNAPSLTLDKIVTNDNGGTAAESDWTLTANGGTAGTLSGAGATGHTDVQSGASFKAGTYALSESGTPTGYTASSWSCVKNGGAAVSGSSITLGLGDTATCTITNNDNAPSLTLDKIVVNDNGGSAAESAWTLTANGGTAGTLSGAGASGHTDVQSGAAFKAGTYALSESGGPSGYTASAWSCVKNGGAAVEGSSITLAPGDVVTCTITNNDQVTGLTLDKIVVNDNGGAAAESAWTLTANGGAAGTLTGPGATGHTDVQSGAGFKPGTYALSESGGPSGYTASAWSCVKNGGAAVNGSSITLALGDSAVCTITNNDNAPSLTLDKIVTNDNGGTAAESDFTLTANGGTAGTLTGPGASGHTDVHSGASFNAGTYALSESGGPSGYTASSWSCVKNGGAAVSGSSVTIALGDTVVCTITNNDNAPSLTLDKIVVNDNGGTAHESDWTLTADGGTAGTLAGPGATGHTDVQSGASFKAGTYALSESAGPSGYTASSFSCVKNGGAPVSGSSVTIALGDTVVCTITNDDNGPSLTLDKIVVNDNGGTAAESDWTLTADGGTAGTLTGPGATGHTDVQSTASFKAGTYTLSESGGPSDYAASDWSCVKNDGAPVTGDSITIGLGDSAVCTITNDDIGPTITVQKRLLPANDAGRFGFTIDPDAESPIVDDNEGAGYGDQGATDPITVSAGTHAITEAAVGSTDGTAYATTWSCSNEQSGTGTSIELDSLALGDNVTCTFTNTHLATLIVKKVVDNSNGGGSKGPADFTLNVTGPGGFSMSGAGSSSGTTYSGLMPGTYHVGELAVSGYNQTAISGCLADGSIILAAGASATCTVTNTSNAPPPPPPPPPPAPRIDLSITKTGAPSPATVGNNVTWTMVVTNNGPNNATGVNVADPMPTGTTYVSSTSSQGTCTGGAILSCTIGNLNVGASVTITLVTTANVTGTIPNTAMVVGNEAETNTANNTASANVTVIGKFTPPPVKPTYCTALFVTPKQLFVGRHNVLKIKVTQHGKAVAGVRVRIHGSTISVLTVGSNKAGIVKHSVKPLKAGIVTFAPKATKQCNAPKIGVIGVFTPPVTG